MDKVVDWGYQAFLHYMLRKLVIAIMARIRILGDIYDKAFTYTHMFKSFTFISTVNIMIILVEKGCSSLWLTLISAGVSYLMQSLILILAFSEKIRITSVLTERPHKLVCFVFAGAEKVIGWARNHYLSSCPSPSINEGRLILPRERYWHGCWFIFEVLYVKLYFILLLSSSFEVLRFQFKD